MMPWQTDNKSHEGGQDSETKMLNKINEIIKKQKLKVFYTAPKIPVSIAIFNEEGATARIRENKRYGKYFAPDDGVHYYNIYDFDEAISAFSGTFFPVNIEDIANSIGWTLPIDENGNWIKSKASPELWEYL